MFSRGQMYVMCYMTTKWCRKDVGVRVSNIFSPRMQDTETSIQNAADFVLGYIEWTRVVAHISSLPIARLWLDMTKKDASKVVICSRMLVFARRW